MAQNFNLGTLGQVLAVNTAANTVTVNSALVIGNSGANVTINGTSFSGTANNASYLGGTTASGYQTTAGLSANVATLAANSATYLGGNTASDLRTYTDDKAGNAYSNATSYADTKASAAYSNAIAYSGNAAAAYANAIAYSGNAAAAYANAIAYSGNAAAAYTNAVSYVDGKSYVNTNQLSTNLSNYAALSGATFTGAVVVSNNLTVTGNLTLSGNTLIVGANNLVVSDAVISLHTPANLAALTSNDGKNIGLAFHYYDTEDRHALLYRDNSTGYLQYHTDGSDPISNANPTGNSFGTIQAARFWAGNDSVYSTVNATNYTGTANNASYLGGTAAASYVQNTDSRTLSGNLNFTGVNTYFSAQATHAANIIISSTAGISANGGYGTSGQALTTNGSAVYWSTIVGTNTAAQYTWSNTQTFSNTITFSSTINGTANNALYLGGTLAASYVQNTDSRTLSGNLAFSGANNTFSGITTFSNTAILRGYTGGTVGSVVNNYSKTLVIGGAYNQTYNSGNSVLMHIADYSNDSGDNVYPIYAEDENNNIDFYLFAGNNSLGTDKRAYFGGSVGVGNSSFTDKLSVNGTSYLGGNVSINNHTTISTTTVSDITNTSYGALGGSSKLTLYHDLNTVNFGTIGAIGMRYARGSVGSPTSVEDTDRLGALFHGAYHLGLNTGAGGWINPVLIASYVDGNTSTVSTAVPGRLTFWTTPINGTRTERMSISSNGNIGIGNSAPTDKLSINGTTYFSANVTLQAGLIANGSVGTSGYVLTSNGSTGSPYWAAAAGGGYYAKGGSATVGSASDANNIFRVNGQTLYNNTTISATENAQCAGPLTINTGVTLAITTGGRVVIS